MLSNVVPSSPRLLEFKTVTFHIVPIRVTDAERANGTSERARITMVAHLYRSDNGPWQDGPDLQPRDTNDIMGRVLAQADGDMFGMGGGGAIALEIVKFKGRWAVTRSSTTLSGPVSFGSGYYYVDDLLKARAWRYSCAAGKALPPPPTADELAAAKKETDRKASEQAEAAKARAEQAAQARQEEAARKEEEAVRAARKAKLAAWTFEAGSVRDFMAALRANLAKRAAEYGFSVANYEPELRQIENMADACVKETPLRWKGAQNYLNDELRSPRTPELDPRITVRNFLHGCDGGDEIVFFGERISPKDKPYGIGIARSMSAYAADTTERVPTPYVTITVSLALRPEDWKAVPDLSMEDRPLHNEVIEARISLLSKEGL